MMLMGGGFKGGQVIADWPGLRQAQLYEGRDLKPTASLEATIATAVSDHFTLDRDRIMRGVYPDLAGLNPSAGFT